MATLTSIKPIWTALIQQEATCFLKTTCQNLASISTSFTKAWNFATLNPHPHLLSTTLLAPMTKPDPTSTNHHLASLSTLNDSFLGNEMHRHNLSTMPRK